MIASIVPLGCRREGGEGSAERQSPSVEREESTAPPETDDPSALPSDESVTDVPLEPSLPALPHRLLVLLSDRLLLVDVKFVMDGSSHEQYVNDLTRDVLSCADLDHNGEVSWQEITTAEAFRFGQLGNVRIENEDQRKQIVRRCDVNRDDRVDPSEIAGFLAAPGTASPWISAAGSPEPDAAALGSALFEWLDVNQDLQLDSREIQGTPSRLRMLDREDDGILERSDLPGQSGIAGRRAGNRADTSRDDRSHIVKLQENSDWSRVLFSIEEKYAFGSPLQAADMPLNQALFHAVDTDSDGYWAVDEGHELLRQAADLTLSIEFGEEGPLLRIDTTGDDVLPASPTAAGRNQVSLPLADGELIIQADQAPAIAELQWQQLWPNWDRDSDGSLDADEYGAAEVLLGLPLVAADRNGDGRLQSAEGFDVLRRRSHARNARVQVELVPDAEPVWRHLDANGDGRLSERELDTAAARLNELTSTSNGVTANDLPPTLNLRFHRGEPGTAAGIPTVAVAPTSATSPASSVPRWFEQMDRNRDGEISPREFLGPPTILEQLDRNGDRMLQVDEVSSGD